MKKYLLSLLLPLLLAACTPTEAVRGNLLKDYQLQQVKPGIDTQSDVLKKLGSPTTKAPFDDNVWYYLGQKTEKRGILDPQITEERVVKLTFDQSGTLQHIVGDDPGRVDVPYVREKTPTSGHDMTVLQQMLGNMGRFNKDTGDSSSSATTGTGGMGGPRR